MNFNAVRKMRIGACSMYDLVAHMLKRLPYEVSASCVAYVDATGFLVSAVCSNEAHPADVPTCSVHV